MNFEQFVGLVDWMNVLCKNFQTIGEFLMMDGGQYGECFAM